MAGNEGEPRVYRLSVEYAGEVRALQTTNPRSRVKWLADLLWLDFMIECKRVERTTVPNGTLIVHRMPGYRLLRHDGNEIDPRTHISETGIGESDVCRFVEHGMISTLDDEDEVPA